MMPVPPACDTERHPDPRRREKRTSTIIDARGIRSHLGHDAPPELVSSMLRAAHRTFMEEP